MPTLQISVSYLRPTPMSRVIGRGEVLRMGSATAHLQGSLRLPDGTLLATATAAAVLRPFPEALNEARGCGAWPAPPA